MIIPRNSVNHASRCVDSRLKPIELVHRQSSKNSVAVIQPCQDRDTTSPVSDSRLTERRMLLSRRSTAKHPATTLVTCVDNDRPRSIQTPRSRTTDAGWTEFPPMTTGETGSWCKHEESRTTGTLSWPSSAEGVTIENVFGDDWPSNLIKTRLGAEEMKEINYRSNIEELALISIDDVWL